MSPIKWFFRNLPEVSSYEGMAGTTDGVATEEYDEAGAAPYESDTEDDNDDDDDDDEEEEE